MKAKLKDVYVHIYKISRDTGVCICVCVPALFSLCELAFQDRNLNPMG